MNSFKNNISKALYDIKNNKNNSISYIFDNPKFNKGPLRGATITIKDLFATKEGFTQASSKILEDFRPNYDATVIKKLKKSGAALIAKVHSDELGLGGTGKYSAYGHIFHPLDNKRIIGGSSSGSAATFTKNISFALATDTGDSVRLPASYNGHVGFKPSYGAISRFGVFPYASSLDTIAIFSHNVLDVIKFSQVVFGKDPLDLTSKEIDIPENKELKPKKIAFLKIQKNLLNIKIKKKFKKLINKIKLEGIKIDEIEIDINLLKSIEIVYSIISFSEASSNNSNLNGISFGKQIDGKNWNQIITNTRSRGFGKMVQRRFTLGAFFLSKKNQKEIFIRAQKVRRLIKNSLEKIYKKYDFLIFPFFEIAPLINEKKIKHWFSSYLILANLIGNPSISIPFSKINNMPFGINLDSQIYSDKKLLSYALYIEKIILKGDFDE